MTTQAFSVSLLNDLLKKEKVNWEIVYTEQTESTNADAKKTPIEKDKSYLFVTDYQIKGRGQFERKWTSKPTENLLCSISLKLYQQSGLQLLGLVMATAICDGIKTLQPELKPQIKWPNDVLIAGKKIAGILVETQFTAGIAEKVVIGFGLNVNQELFEPELEAKASSLVRLTGKNWQRELLLTEILHSFGIWYEWWSQRDTSLLAAIHNRLIGVESYQKIVQTDGTVLYPKAWIIGLDLNGRLGILNEQEQEIWFEHEQIRLENVH